MRSHVGVFSAMSPRLSRQSPGGRRGGRRRAGAGGGGGQEEREEGGEDGVGRLPGFRGSTPPLAGWPLGQTLDFFPRRRPGRDGGLRKVRPRERSVDGNFAVRSNEPDFTKEPNQVRVPAVDGELFSDDGTGEILKFGVTGIDVRQFLNSRKSEKKRSVHRRLRHPVPMGTGENCPHRGFTPAALRVWPRPV